MKVRTPVEAGYATGDSLEPVGPARRCVCTREGKTVGELWRLPNGSDGLRRRLQGWGQRGVGGFTDGGEDEEGPWLVRRMPASLSSWMQSHEGPAPWKRAVSMGLGLARCLARCEAASVVPGTIRPEDIDVVADERAELRADEFVYGLLGIGASRSREGSRWLAPEQGTHAQPDHASNRYVLGLVLYRLLAGQHAFSGGGLRKSLADRAHRGAPPFPAAIAQSLPPGLQGYCLRLLAPKNSDRPQSASAIVERLEAFESGRSRAQERPSRVSRERPRLEPPQNEAPGVSSRVSRQRPIRPVLASFAVVIGVVGASLALAVFAPKAATRVQVGERSPLAEALSVQDCASCHPRQVSEWRRSVMAHSAKSPLFQSLEMLIQEQVGKSRECPEGAGVLRVADPATACRNGATGAPLTGAGGEHWCVNCHSPSENLRASMPAWNGTSPRSSSRRPLKDLLSDEAMEGIGCGFCHQVAGPVRPGNARVGRYEGNGFWSSPVTGQSHSMRPEDALGRFGIANSGYLLQPLSFLLRRSGDLGAVPGGAHLRPEASAREYLRSSEFCGSCHDVRLFGTDVIGVGEGEHFKRLRNAYSEWVAWKEQEEREGRVAATCQDCHMSTYPGVCEPGGDSDGRSLCPEGTHFSPRAPGSYPTASASAGSISERVSLHYFSGVDVPLSSEFPLDALDDDTLDTTGLPMGARQRRDLLLANTFRLDVSAPRVRGENLIIPIEFENIGAGHRVPAGFSQEREVWIHLRVTDERGRAVYEVGRIGRGDEDLADKIFVDVNTSDESTDAAGRPIGLFGADIIDGPDVPEWTSVPGRANEYRGRGLVNLQNGFLRCVRCIGQIDEAGRCQAGPGQGLHRADRYADGDYDIDSGECRSNLRGRNALFETYFPIGALDAGRGLVRGPDAIVDDRSAPPNTPIRYTYEVPTLGSQGPYRIEARLMFRAFPPFLLRAFADYEARQDRRGRRPSGPLLTPDLLNRLEAIEIARAEAAIP